VLALRALRMVSSRFVELQQRYRSSVEQGRRESEALSEALAFPNPEIDYARYGETSSKRQHIRYTAIFYVILTVLRISRILSRAVTPDGHS
jgi:type II secretory pathway component PulF